MINEKRVFPECCADTLLAELILGGKPAHSKGISKVSKVLEKLENNQVYSVGLVDNDPFTRTPTYLNSFTEVVEDKMNPEYIIIKKLPNTNKHLIRLEPAFEKWILKAAETCGVNYLDFGFTSFEEFKNVTKRKDVIDDLNFKRFVRAVIDANPPAIQTLRKWLKKVHE